MAPKSTYTCESIASHITKQGDVLFWRQAQHGVPTTLEPVGRLATSGATSRWRNINPT